MSDEAYKRIIGKYFPEKAEPGYADPFWFQFQQIRMQAQAMAQTSPLQELVKALSAGSFDAAPSELRQGSRWPSDPHCDVCRIELCQELDAYYGKNPNGKHHCVKCRKLKGIT